MHGREIIKEIEKLCFYQDISNRRNLHYSLIRGLRDLLRRYNYHVTLEQPIVYWHLLRRKGFKEIHRGYIDLFAVSLDTKIAIELDDGVTLKYKSIEKLLQSDADLRIGIVRGKIGYSHISILSLIKICEVMSYLQITDKRMHLIIISNRLSKEITWEECGIYNKV